MEREFLHREVNPVVKYPGEESSVYSTNQVQDKEPGLPFSWFLVSGLKTGY